jgi:ketosteroid isomerase-like protein
MSTEDEIRGASATFYAALNSMAQGDAGPMADIWSHSETVTTMHPIGGEQTGWDAVRESFEQVSGLATDGSVELAGQVIQTGDGELAYETGTERGRLKVAGEQITIDQRVTNIYRREPEGWRIVHHHTDLSPAMLDMLERLQAA